MSNLHRSLLPVLFSALVLPLSACTHHPTVKEQLINYLANPPLAHQAARMCLAKLQVGDKIDNDINCQAVIQYSTIHCSDIKQQGGWGEQLFFSNLDCHNPLDMLGFAAKGM